LAGSPDQPPRFTGLPRLRARTEMIVFLRRLAWLCMAIVLLLVAGTVGFVLIEGTSSS
jgi:hypothetical protein